MNALTLTKRNPKRSRVFLSAQFDMGSGPVDAHIRDISSAGAMLEAECTPEPDAEITVVCGKVRAEARVIWSERGWFGVEFEKPLLMTSLMDAKGAKLRVSAPRTYHSGNLPD